MEKKMLKTLGVVTAVALMALSGTAHATGPAAIAAAGALSASGASADGGSGGDASTKNKTEGSYGLALGFPDPAAGRDYWGSMSVFFGLYSQTLFEREILTSETLAGAVQAFVLNDNPSKTAVLVNVLAATMCSSDDDEIRRGGGRLYGLELGLPGCLVPDGDR